MMMLFLSGAIMMACAACGLFFIKSWRATRDRFFLLFAAAFWALAIERWALFLVDPRYEMRFYVYMIRFLAFALIAAAIVEKNIKSRR